MLEKQLAGQLTMNNSAISITAADRMKKRFRGFLPVVVDVETGGFNAETDALLEIATVLLEINNEGQLYRGETIAFHVEPFSGANLEPSALAFTGIDPYHPFRFALPEKQVLQQTFKKIYQAIKMHHCQRAVLVGHNPTFDLGFIKAAVKRQGLKKNPFHSFTTFDTATLGALAYGQTVLARAVRAAGFSFDQNEAHSAIYDAERTADLFCSIVNQWPILDEQNDSCSSST
ncbi:MAG: ribonuclease T [Gammaproteobacteria bacterium]